ncbi:MAG: LysR family transcriptional regulator [Alphaproteobacteria bacterium]
MDWDKLRIFHSVAEAGSFTHAGEALKLSQSAVSRQIGALEESLKVPLFHRHARGLELTEQGELLYRTAHDVFGKVAMAEAMLVDSLEKPRGELKVTTTVGFGTTWLTPRVREFLDMYPDISLRLLVVDHELDLSMREADVAIRMRAPTQPDLIQRRLITVHYHIYAAPEYLRRYGSPRSIDDFSGHRLVIYGEEAPPPIADINWLMQVARRGDDAAGAVLRINNIYGVLRAVESGVGIAALPDYLARDNPGLVQVLTDVEGPSFVTYFVYPEELRDSKRVAVFRDFLLRQVAAWNF